MSNCYWSAMRLELRGQQVELTETLRAHVARRLQYALGRFGPYVLQETVLLANLNDPHGGNAKQCRIAVALQQSGHLHVEEMDADLYTAIDRAAERIGFVVARDLERWGEFSVRMPTAICISTTAFFRREPYVVM
jgi:putative sigma-54 modulation protein